MIYLHSNLNSMILYRTEYWKLSLSPLSISICNLLLFIPNDDPNPGTSLVSLESGVFIDVNKSIEKLINSTCVNVIWSFGLNTYQNLVHDY